jgi:fumarate reductase flavoprotein subunit
MRYAITGRAGLLLGAVIWASVAWAQAPAAAATGKPDLATFHAQQVQLACAGCHADGKPETLSAEQSLAAVNRQCVACHGDAAKLAEAIAPKLANKHINPHASHLVAIDCTTCHAGHAVAESFCLQCHAFDMPMPGRARAAKP